MSTRDTKFRAWDEVDKKMRSVTRMTFGLPATGHKAFLLHLDDGTENPVTRQCEEGEPENRAVLMQFTGLHDKNGKEIYEGDVIYITHKYGPNLTGELFYDDTFAVYRIKGDNITDWVERAGCYEVRGNIYENPELISKP